MSVALLLSITAIMSVSVAQGIVTFPCHEDGVDQTMIGHAAFIDLGDDTSIAPYNASDSTNGMKIDSMAHTHTYTHIAHTHTHALILHTVRLSLSFHGDGDDTDDGYGNGDPRPYVYIGV